MNEVRDEQLKQPTPIDKLFSSTNFTGVEFTITGGRRITISPYSVSAVLDESGGDPVQIVLQDGLTYGVKGTYEEVIKALEGITE